MELRNDYKYLDEERRKMIINRRNKNSRIKRGEKIEKFRKWGRTIKR